MEWIEEMDNYNFLGIYDVMLDIKTEMNISPDRIIIPLLQHRVKFTQLFSIDSAGERDRYCGLRWKAIIFLKKKAIIKDFRLIKSSHRWDGKLKIELEKQIFEDVLDKMNIKHKKEVSREISNAQNNKVIDDIIQNNQEKSKIKENTKKLEIFLSYSHKDKEIADGVDKFFISKKIRLTRDVRDALPYSSLKKFMETIRDHDYVISLISDAYLKSTNCMFEIIQFIQEKKYVEKIFPIIIDKKDDIFNKEKHINYISFWQNKYKRFGKKINKLENTGTAPSHVELDKIDKIQSNIGEFLDKIAELKCFPIDELESTNYKAISDKIGKPFGVFPKEEIEVESEKLKLRIIGCLYKWYVEVLEQSITPTFNIEKKINEWKISSKLMHKVIDEMIDDGYIKHSSFGGQIKLTKQGRLLARKEKLEHKYDYRQCGKGE